MCRVGRLNHTIPYHTHMNMTQSYRPTQPYLSLCCVFRRLSAWTDRSLQVYQSGSRRILRRKLGCTEKGQNNLERCLALNNGSKAANFGKVLISGSTSRAIPPTRSVFARGTCWNSDTCRPMSELFYLLAQSSLLLCWSPGWLCAVIDCSGWYCSQRYAAEYPDKLWYAFDLLSYSVIRWMCAAKPVEHFSR